MPIQSDWFEPLTVPWRAGEVWSQPVMTALLDTLKEISMRSGGRVLGNIGDDLRIDHARRRASSALNAFARSVEHAWVHPDPPYSWHEDAGVQAPLPFLLGAAMTPRINLNTAAWDILEALPGIGPVTARRIVEYRMEKGPFKDAEEVIRVQGIDRGDYERFQYHVYAGPVSGPLHLASQSAAAFMRRPKFDNLVNLIRETNLTVTRFAGQEIAEALEGRVLGLVRETKTELDAGHLRACRRGPAVTPEFINRAEARRVEGERVYGGKIEGDMQAVVLEDTAYMSFVLQLIEQAQQRIRLVMFFLRYEDVATYPTDNVIAALETAHSGGVDVRVILDRDAEGEGVGATTINDAAFQRFTQVGIPVRYDSVEFKTHSKLLIVDNAHTVIGSHNWTAGSFFAYDDTSVYIHSRALTTYYLTQFDRLWEEYAPV